MVSASCHTHAHTQRSNRYMLERAWGPHRAAVLPYLQPPLLQTRTRCSSYTLILPEWSTPDLCKHSFCPSSTESICPATSQDPGIYTDAGPLHQKPAFSTHTKCHSFPFLITHRQGFSISLHPEALSHDSSIIIRSDCMSLYSEPNTYFRHHWVMYGLHPRAKKKKETSSGIVCSTLGHFNTMESELGPVSWPRNRE